MTRHLIITRHNESLAWVKAVDPAAVDRVFIYDKSPTPLPDSLTLRNVGLEHHGHLTHIVRNWDRLPDWLLFCQGYPFDHVHCWIDVCNAGSFESAVAVNRRWYPANNLQADGFAAFGVAKSIHRGLIDEDPTVKDNPDQRRFHQRKYELLSEWWAKLRPGQPEPKAWPTAWGALMLVSRERVKSVPMETYYYLLDWHERDRMAPYAMENFWWQLWACSNANDRSAAADAMAFSEPADSSSVMA